MTFVVVFVAAVVAVVTPATSMQQRNENRLGLRWLYCYFFTLFLLFQSKKGPRVAQSIRENDQLDPPTPLRQ